MDTTIVTALIVALSGIMIAILRNHSKKLEVIHILVNSNLEKVKQDLIIALNDISVLKNHIISLKADITAKKEEIRVKNDTIVDQSVSLSNAK